MPLFSPLFAVHISDGVLTAPWLIGGFALAAVLMLLGSWRIREEEIPRIALLTAAFFVASLLHLRLGPTSVHLLLNGLVGVVLGWRAALAIPVGLFLQAALIGHGGFSTLGVNSCVMTIPALLASGSFKLWQRAPHHLRRPGWRAVGVAVGTALLTMALLVGVAVTFSLRGTELKAPQFDEATKLALAKLLDEAMKFALHPASLLVAAVIGIVAAFLDRRLEEAPEYAIGLLLGAGAVVGTALLNALVLLFGGAENWHALVLFVLVAHLPLAVIEGIVVGFAVCFLARVKPELLAGAEKSWQPALAAAASDGIATPPGIEPARNGKTQDGDRARITSTLSFLLAAASLLALAQPAHAHRLNGQYCVLPKEHKIKVESWFETGDSPRNATVQVFRADQTQLAGGQLNDNGVFVFAYQQPEAMRIVVNAPGGHRKEMVISSKELEAPGGTTTPSSTASESSSNGSAIDAADNEKSFADRSSRTSVKDVLLGISVLLSVAGFVLAVLNARRLRGMKRDTP